MKPDDRSPAGFCALCAKKAKLERSHLIPRFVYRGLQVPDGPTRTLLCGACEDLFSGDESTFAREVFHPLVADSRVVTKYDRWLLKFAASVCWRVLEDDSLAGSQLAAGDTRWASPLASCRETWRQFLVGKRSGVGEHHIHLLLADGDAVEREVVATDREAFVYVRLGPVILFGLVACPDSAQWRCTRVHLEGKLKPRETFVPARYRDYLSSRPNPSDRSSRPLR